MQDRGGFTLIELLLVLAIIGVLSSIAFPAYTAHLLRVHRLEGAIALTEAMQREDAVYGRINRYVLFGADMDNAGTGVGGSGGSGSSGGVADSNGFKWWSGATAAASAYELHARPCAASGDDAADGAAVGGPGAGGAALNQCVALVAVPGTERVNQRFRDTECGALILLSTGERRSEGRGAACWP